VRALRDHHHGQLATTVGVLVHANAMPEKICPHCNGPLHVQKTATRNGRTLAHGHFIVNETTFFCPACKVRGPKKDKHLFIKRAEELKQLLLPRSSMGYDVMVFCGTERFLKYRQREEIQGDLRKYFGIDISTGKISDLERAFTVYFKALHELKAPQLKAALGGGYPLHIDATCETGRGTLFVAYCGEPEWVLGAWKIPTERADAILPRLLGIESLFGAPCSIMRDLGRAVTEAAIDLAGDRQIPIFACHLHFLKDIGKDLLVPGHDKLRELFRRHKVRARLANHARTLGRSIGTEIDKAQEMVNKWLKDERHQALPPGEHGMAVVRALTQWVLDYGADGSGAGFPFDCPMLDLYNRCKQALRVAESLLEHPAEKPVHRALVILHRILLPVRGQIPYQSLAQNLRARRKLFEQLRGTLRMEAKPKAIMACQKLECEQKKELHNAEKALAAFEKSLRKIRPERGPAQDIREAIDIILKHLERHGQNLWGHLIERPDGTTILVARTNVMLERFFGNSKRGERRRSGRKNLAQDLEQLPAEALLALNLESQTYLDIVCEGKIENLAAAFAGLDDGSRSQSLPIRLQAENLESEESPDIVSSSLPSVDRALVRTDAWLARMTIEAKSRAPLRQDHRKQRSATVG